MNTLWVGLGVVAVAEAFTLVTAYFNFVNRIAMSLGVESTPDELTGYKDD